MRSRVIASLSRALSPLWGQALSLIRVGVGAHTRRSSSDSSRDAPHCSSSSGGRYCGTFAISSQTSFPLGSSISLMDFALPHSDFATCSACLRPSLSLVGKMTTCAPRKLSGYSGSC